MQCEWCRRRLTKECLQKCFDFCSASHALAYAHWSRDREKPVCEECGKLLTPYQVFRNNRFCSFDCAVKSPAARRRSKSSRLISPYKIAPEILPEWMQGEIDPNMCPLG